MSKSPQVKTFRVAETPFLLLRRRVPLPPGKPRTAAAYKGTVSGVMTRAQHDPNLCLRPIDQYIPARRLPDA
jgi:hypothetical protein